MTTRKNETIIIEETDSNAPITVDQIPFDGNSEPQENDKALQVVQDNSLILAEGLSVSMDSSDDEIDRMIELVQSYVGVKPIKVAEILGEWVLCIGCALVPFEREVKRYYKEIDEVSGEEYMAEGTTILRWKAPLFKLADKNKQGQFKIVSGGGGAALDFIMRYAKLGRAGDWKSPKEILFSQEDRSTVNAQNEKVPTRMYRIDVRTPKS